MLGLARGYGQRPRGSPPVHLPTGWFGGVQCLPGATASSHRSLPPLVVRKLRPGGRGRARLSPATYTVQGTAGITLPPGHGWGTRFGQKMG